MKKAGIAYFTERGQALALRIASGLEDAYEILWYEKGLKQWCETCFAQAEALIFIGACGIAVRTIAPYLKSKTEDPAVVVLDEAGQYVISLLSGHIGGANAFALKLAGLTGAVPVITTASDVRGKIAVDVFAKQNHLEIAGMKAAKEIAAAILRDEPVGICCTGDTEGRVPPELTMIPYNRGLIPASEDGRLRQPDWEEKKPEQRGSTIEKRMKVQGDAGEESKKGMHLIWISEHQITDEELRYCFDGLKQAERKALQDTAESLSDSPFERTAPEASTVLHLIPRAVTVGIGCRRGKSAEEIEQAVRRILSDERIPLSAVLGAASIDLKKEEQGILATCQALAIPFTTYSAETLSTVKGEFEPSDFVKKTTGVDNVCERSALALAGPAGRIIRKKYAENGVTVALAVREWRIHFGK